METSITTANRQLAPVDARPDQNAAVVYLASLTSPQSRRTMQTALNNLARLMGAPDLLDADGKPFRGARDLTFLSIQWGELRYAQTAALRARLMEQYPPSTANKMLAALRGVLRQAWKLEQMPAEAYHRAVDVKSISGDTIPAGRELTDGEIYALVQACKRDTTPAGNRDAAIIGVLYTCGLRRAELVALDVSDYDRDNGKITIRAGKGRKARTVYVSGGAKAALEVWLGERGLTPGALFVPILKGRKDDPNPRRKIQTARRLTPQAVYNLLEKRGKQAGLADFSPHDFRRSMISTLLDRGVDLVTVSKIAGHSRTDTSKRYDRRGEEVKQRAAEKIHFPF